MCFGCITTGRHPPEGKPTHPPDSPQKDSRVCADRQNQTGYPGIIPAARQLHRFFVFFLPPAVQPPASQPPEPAPRHKRDTMGPVSILLTLMQCVCQTAVPHGARCPYARCGQTAFPPVRLADWCWREDVLLAAAVAGVFASCSFPGTRSRLYRQPGCGSCPAGALGCCRAPARGPGCPAPRRFSPADFTAIRAAERVCFRGPSHSAPSATVD